MTIKFHQVFQSDYLLDHRIQDIPFQGLERPIFNEIDFMQNYFWLITTFTRSTYPFSLFILTGFDNIAERVVVKSHVITVDLVVLWSRII